MKIRPSTSPLSRQRQAQFDSEFLELSRACGACPRAARSRERANSSAILANHKFPARIWSLRMRARVETELVRCGLCVGVNGYVGLTGTIDARQGREQESAEALSGSASEFGGKAEIVR